MGEVIGIIIFGAVIGLIARAVKPGTQKIGLLWTLIIGIVGALAGYYLAGLVGVADTPGIDWIRWVFSIIVAVILLGIYIAMSTKRSAGPRITK